MPKLNKKAAENTAIFSTAKNVSSKLETTRLSDKIRLLYRFFKLSKVLKGAVYQTIDSFYLKYSTNS